MTINTKRIKSIELENVEVTDPYMVNAFDKEIDYLLSIDDDKMLAGFRDTAGIDTKGAERYEGWENMLIGGHTMGHYLTALAQSYVNRCASLDVKNKIKDKIDYIITSLLECQDNSKGKKGFIFGAAILDRDNVEIQFDNVEKRMTNIITEAWVPWYTMHKILAGIIDVYKFTGNEDAFTLAKGLGDWTYDRASSWSPELNEVVLSTEYGGMNDALYELYKCTGDIKYAKAAHFFDQDKLFKRIAEGSPNALDGLHANTTIPKFLGAIGRYVALHGKEADGNVVDCSEYLAYAEAFFDMVVNKHTYATGGNSEWEHFGLDNVLDAERTNANNETCNTYNMLKLAKTLFEVTGSSKYLDYYENTFINSILSSQNPENGMTTYFQPMSTGYFKVYGQRYNKFWCCTGTGMENFTKLGDSFFYEDDKNIYIGLYMSSFLYNMGKELVYKIEADLLSSDFVKITIGEGYDGRKLALRIPCWIDGDIEVKVNDKVAKCSKTKVNDIDARYSKSKDSDKDAKCSKSNGFVVIEDALKEGDCVSVRLPMKIYTRALPDENSCMALCYGPYVLSADLGDKDLSTTTTGVDVTIPAEKIVDSEYITIPDGMTAAQFSKAVSEYVKPVMNPSGQMAFKISGSDYIFAPHFLKYRHRYGIYFYYMTSLEQQNDKAVRKNNKANVLDMIEAGYGQYENDDLHKMADNGSVGTTSPITSRRAIKGGSFTYRMVVNPGRVNTLSVTVLTEDDGLKLMIKAADTFIYNEVLDHSKYVEDTDASKYTIDIELPLDLVKKAELITAYGKEYLVIPVSFMADSSEDAARITDFVVIR